MKVIFTILFLFLVEEALSKSDRVKLRDVQVLTLKKGQYTSGRRSRKVPQLACVGGTARCAFIPDTVQCYNKGWDGQTVNWECKAEMDKKYSFGQLEVTCEGYDHPDDSYILAGSCGLEFTLNLAPGAYQQSNHQFRPPKMPGDAQELKSESFVFVIIVFGVLIVILYLFIKPKRPEPSAPPPPPPGFRPDYFGTAPPPYESTFGSSSSSSHGTTGGGPGFGTGLGVGAFMGYVFGRNSGNSRNSGYSRHHNTYDSSFRSSGFAGTPSPPPPPPSSNQDSTETKTASGFATTKRR